MADTDRFTDMLSRDPLSAQWRLVKVISEQYERWVRSSALGSDVARNRVSPGTAMRRVWGEFAVG